MRLQPSISLKRNTALLHVFWRVRRLGIEWRCKMSALGEEVPLEFFEEDVPSSIIEEMRNRTDLRGDGMVDNFDVTIGEYGGWDALLLIKAYANRLDAACKRLEAAHKREMDEAADHIQDYLQEIPMYSKAHNWLIRNGYRDTSYQSSIFGQKIVKEGDLT